MAEDTTRTSINEVVQDIFIETKISKAGNPYNVYLLRFKSGFEKSLGFVERAEKYMLDDMLAKSGTSEDPGKLNLED